MVFLNLKLVLTSWLLFSFVLLLSQMSYEVFFLKSLSMGRARIYACVRTRGRARARVPGRRFLPAGGYPFIILWPLGISLDI